MIPQNGMIRIDQVRTDSDVQPRAELSEDAIRDYLDAMRRGDVFPAIVVFHGSGAYWLADGFHRVEAARRAGLEETPADIRDGGKRDAILHAVGANATHGVRRTNEDKRRCVMMLLRGPEWQEWSDHEIARRACVSHSFVSNMRHEPELTVNGLQSPAKRKAADGRTIDTRRIGVGRKARSPRPTAPTRPPVAGDTPTTEDPGAQPVPSPVVPVVVEESAVGEPAAQESSDLDPSEIGVYCAAH